MAVSKQVSLFVFVASIMLVLAAFDGTKAQEAKDVLLLPYDAKSLNWDMSGTSCAAWAANTTLDLRRRYGWVAVGVPADDLPCGRCLKVTNSATEKSMVVRVVDKCEDAEFQLDRLVLEEMIGSDGRVVDIALHVGEFIDCKDK